MYSHHMYDFSPPLICLGSLWLWYISSYVCTYLTLSLDIVHSLLMGLLILLPYRCFLSGGSGIPILCRDSVRVHIRITLKSLGFMDFGIFVWILWWLCCGIMLDQWWVFAYSDYKRWSRGSLNSCGSVRIEEVFRLLGWRVVSKECFD